MRLFCYYLHVINFVLKLYGIINLHKMHLNFSLFFNIKQNNYVRFLGFVRDENLDN